jgi:hypothetical protein
LLWPLPAATLIVIQLSIEDYNAIVREKMKEKEVFMNTCRSGGRFCWRRRDRVGGEPKLKISKYISLKYEAMRAIERN